MSNFLFRQNLKNNIIYRQYLYLTPLLGIFTILTHISTAQTTFADKSITLPNSGFYTWLQKGITDMNADGRDDIVRANPLGYFFVLTQNLDGTFTEKALGQIQSKTPLSVILGDIDNNGYADILTGGEYDGVRVIKANNDASVYATNRLPQDSIFTQASALADINNDGWLDIFMCNDDSTNGVWKNDKTGTFLKDKMGFDFSSIPLNKHAGNYGIVFTDFDNDGDLDAYLSKCKAGVTDVTDPRRINQLFVNTNGVFTDQARQYNMADSSQSWVTEFQDIDNDGDMDAFIANHYTSSRLMLNNGSGYFTDITTSSGLLGVVPDGILQALMRDFDNDGYVDIIVAGMMSAKFFHNNGNNTFSTINLPLLKIDDTNPLRSFTVGDLNHDGFLDLYTSYHFSTNIPDKLWLNTKNSNHFLAITLKGTKSNLSGVGAKITLQVNGQTQIREVRAGESYGISNSLTQYFGIGAATNITSIEVKWPSGERIVLQNPMPDQFLTLAEPIPICSLKSCISVGVRKL